MIDPTPLLLAAVALCPVQDGGYTAPEPTVRNAATWTRLILPTPEEVRYESIPWLASFGEGMIAADELGKPLLFWGMNGHPLGCT